jgi:hypothetical protein
MARTDHRIDRELFHSWLWQHRGRKDVITMKQTEMAEQLKCSVHTPSRLIRELIEAGKVMKVRNGLYRVIDPEKTEVLD